MNFIFHYLLGTTVVENNSNSSNVSFPQPFFLIVNFTPIINSSIQWGAGEATSQLPPKPSSFPPNVACCEPYIALDCISGDLKFKIFWGKTPPDPH